jgi:hypothetical protein
MGGKDRGGLRVAAGGATFPGPHAASGDFLTDCEAFVEEVRGGRRKPMGQGGVE